MTKGIIRYVGVSDYLITPIVLESGNIIIYCDKTINSIRHRIP